MSTAAGSPAAGPGDIREVEEQRGARNSLGLGPATALIVGSIIGVGIFNLPGSLAAYGPISLLAMGLTTVGRPGPGGDVRRRCPRGCPRTAVRTRTRAPRSATWRASPTPGCTGSPRGRATPRSSSAGCSTSSSSSTRTATSSGPIVLALIGLWIPAAINLSGVKNMGAVQLWTSVLKFIPLVFMSTVGLFFISTANFHPWNVSGDSNVAAIGGAMALCLFSYLGVETAAVAAAKVRNPDSNVPRATIVGTLGTAVVYLLSLTAVFGIVSAARSSASRPRRSPPRSTRSSAAPGPAT